MAFLYKRKRSPFWWISYIDDGGRRIMESTQLRVDSMTQSRQAKAIAAERTARELKGASRSTAGRWENWVPDFISGNMSASPKSIFVYQGKWRVIQCYLSEHRIHHPAQLSYDNLLRYWEWRQKGHKNHALKPCSSNTAKDDLSLLGSIMDEAIRRGFATTNPARLVRIKTTPRKVKPEIEPDHIKIIREAAQNEEEWLRLSFEIAYWTGLRLRESRLRMSDVDFDRNIIHIRSPKGGPNRTFYTPIHPQLRPILLPLANREFAFTFPANPAAEFIAFLKKIGLPQYSFHCLRVTFISRGARAGIDERVMQRLVNHASRTVHRIYQRFTTDDLSKAISHIT